MAQRTVTTVLCVVIQDTGLLAVQKESDSRETGVGLC